MIKKIWEYLLEAAGIWTAIFVAVWLLAWGMNALRGTHFDVSSLQSMYLTVILPRLGFHGVNSIFNSPQNQPPK